MTNNYKQLVVDRRPGAVCKHINGRYYVDLRDNNGNNICLGWGSTAPAAWRKAWDSIK